jgi:uncharacterized protein YhaN
MWGKLAAQALKVAAVAGAAALTAMTSTVLAKATSDYKEKGRRMKLDEELMKIESKIMERD